MFICVYSAHTHTHTASWIEGGKIGLTVYKVIVCVMGAILKRSRPRRQRRCRRCYLYRPLFELVLAICLPFSSGVFSTCSANTNLQIPSATGALCECSPGVCEWVCVFVKSINFCRHSPFIYKPLMLFPLVPHPRAQLHHHLPYSIILIRSLLISRHL